MNVFFFDLGGWKDMGKREGRERESELSLASSSVLDFFIFRPKGRRKDDTKKAVH